MKTRQTKSGPSEREMKEKIAEIRGCMTLVLLHQLGMSMDEILDDNIQRKQQQTSIKQENQQCANSNNSQWHRQFKTKNKQKPELTSHRQVQQNRGVQNNSRGNRGF